MQELPKPKKGSGKKGRALELKGRRTVIIELGWKEKIESSTLREEKFGGRLLNRLDIAVFESCRVK
jgi:hypothetical protein